MSKKIGINALFVVPNRVGGTEYHLRSFITYLQQLDKKHEYVIFCNEENFDTFALQSPLWKKVRCSVKGENRIARILYEQFILPRLVDKEGCEVLHSYGYFGPIFGHFKTFLTVHDTNWLDHPEDFPLLQRIVLKILIERSIAVSSLIFTDSEFSLSRLTHYFPAMKHKIKMVLPGLDDVLQVLLDQRQKPVVNKPYILCVSGFYPHKKISYLLKVWEHFSRLHPKFDLVLVGQNGSELDIVRNASEVLQHFQWLPKVSLIELASLYQHADAFVFPSVYEGFGYPVYEAVAAGLPVMVGKKALYMSKLRGGLHEFSFSLEEDVLLLGKLITVPTLSQPAFVPHYTDSVHAYLTVVSEWESPVRRSIA